MFFQGSIEGTGDHRILVLRNTKDGQFLGLDLGPSPARAFRANLSDWSSGRCVVVSMGMQWYAEPRISGFKYVEIAGTRFSVSTGFLIDYSLSFDARYVALFATRHRPTSFGNSFPQRIYVEVQKTEDVAGEALSEHLACRRYLAGGRFRSQMGFPVATIGRDQRVEGRGSVHWEYTRVPPTRQAIPGTARKSVDSRLNRYASAKFASD